MRSVLLVTKQWAWFRPAARSRSRQDVGWWVPGAGEGTDWCLVETVSVWEDGEALEVGGGNSNRTQWVSSH